MAEFVRRARNMSPSREFKFCETFPKSFIKYMSLTHKYAKYNCSVLINRLSTCRLLRHGDDAAERLGDSFASFVVGAVERAKAHGRDTLQVGGGDKLPIIVKNLSFVRYSGCCVGLSMY